MNPNPHSLQNFYTSDDLLVRIETVWDLTGPRGESMVQTLQNLSSASPEMQQLMRTHPRPRDEVWRDFFCSQQNNGKPLASTGYSLASTVILKRVTGNSIDGYVWRWRGVPVNDKGVALFDDPLEVEFHLKPPAALRELTEVFSPALSEISSVQPVNIVSQFLVGAAGVAAAAAGDDDRALYSQCRPEAFGRLTRVPLPEEKDTWAEFARKCPTPVVPLQLVQWATMWQFIDPRDIGCDVMIPITAQLRRLMEEMSRPNDYNRRAEPLPFNEANVHWNHLPDTQRWNAN